MSDGKNECGWVGSGINRDDYLACYRMALIRMAAALNAGKDGAELKAAHLALKDQALADHFEQCEKLLALVRLHEIKGDERQNLEEKAEDHFYGRFRFEEVQASKLGPDKATLCKVTHEATDTFIDWSFKRLHRPNGNNDSLEFESFVSENEFARHCASNYLLKNFWHNYVHEKLQNITHDTYSNFRGEARFDSDFEADNLGNLFLTKSYGLPVNTKGSVSEANRRKILSLHSRNRCNLVFQERAKQRIADRKTMSQEQIWMEYEWRERRRIANYLSLELLSTGAAACRLAVIFCGPLRHSEKSGFWREKPVIAVINGFYIATPYAPYLPSDDPTVSDSSKNITTQRLKDIRSQREKRVREIAENIAGNYHAQLKADSKVRQASQAMYEQVLVRGGFDSIER